MGLIAVADPDLQIGGLGGHPDPEIRGGGLKNFRPQFGPKITGRPDPPPPGPLPWIRL